MDKESFLARNNISVKEFEEAGVDWDNLIEIYDDFISRRQQLEAVAEFVVKELQAFEEVHSVRWRVKDPEHLLEKIIRKQCGKNPSKKYLDISVRNYTKIVTDLVGVRVLHLFKDQFFDIHSKITEGWGFAEKPVSYIREGDHSDLLENFKVHGITPKTHSAGYRSVHYILKVKPNRLEFRIELQVRTIFEEGWSEIDHKVRYPNFSNNKQVETVLKIFNRLAGSADELGAFIRGLSLEMDRYQEELKDRTVERDQALEKMSKMLDELAALQQQNSEASDKVKKLQSELNRFKISSGWTQVGLSDPNELEVAKSSKHQEEVNKMLASLSASILGTPTFPVGKKKK